MKTIKLKNSYLLAWLILSFLSIGVNAQTTYIPDDSFRQILIEDYNAELAGPPDHVLTSSIENIVTLNIEGFRIFSEAINDLTGIENFTSLEVLSCYENEIRHIDLSQNSRLTSLNCEDNNLITLNIKNGNNTNLTFLNATINPTLECIEVDDVTAIPGSWQKDLHTTYSLDCSENYTNIPDNEFRRVLIAHYGAIGGPDSSVLTSSINSIHSLDLYYNEDDPERRNVETPIFDLTGIEDMTALLFLDCFGNNISTIDLSNNTLLHSLNITLNQLISIDLSSNTALNILNINFNNLTELNLENNNVLHSLFCGDNNLHTLNIQNGNNTNLVNFSATFNPNLECIQVDDPTAIPDSWSVDAGVTFSLDCSALISYTYIEDDVFRNYLITEKGVRAGPDDSVVTEDIEIITDLVINDMSITSLVGIEDFTALTYLSCAGNNLSSLDVSQNTELTFVNCARNNINSLNFTQNTELIFLYVGVNPLTYLNIKNGNIDDLAEFRAFENPNLNCIEVDDVIIANGKVDSRRWIIDNHTNFSTDCDATVSIPDPNFETALREQGYDDGTTNDGSVPLRLVESVTALNVSNKNIASLVGIGSFTSLTLLNCSDNNLTALDVSNNSNLTNLDCSTNTNLASLQLSTTPSITRLACYETTLGTLNIDNQTELTQLYCNNAGLTALNVINNTKLTELTCSINNISSLNLDNNTSLVSLYCASNSIGSLDLSRSPELTIVQVASNSLTELNIKNGNNNGLAILGALNNPDLQCIQVDDVILAREKSDWSKDNQANYSTDCDGRVRIPDPFFETALREQGYDDGTLNDGYVPLRLVESLGVLDVSNKNIRSLDGIEWFTLLDELNCSFNEIIYLNLSSNSKLTHLECVANIDVANDRKMEDLLLSPEATGLTYLDCRGNTLTSLNLEYYSQLTAFSCANNTLNDIDVSANTELLTFFCNNNNISNLDLTNNTKLSWLNASFNNLTILNLQANTALTRLLASDNIPLENAYLDNGNNRDVLIFVEINNNPSLSCIQVDDISWPFNPDTNWIKDDDANYSLGCSGGRRIFVPDDNLERHLKSLGHDGDPSNPTLDDYVFAENLATIEVLNINNKNISSLVGIENLTGLTRLEASNNNISDITPLADLTQLTEIYIDNNNLSGDLDFTGNTELEWLRCYTNYNITGLNLRANTKLKRLQAATNSITDIDLSNNLELIRLHLGNNNLNSLDVSLNTNLTQINCQSNNLTSLNLQNGNNRNIHREEFDARNNPSLTCIQVDNPLDVFRLLRWGLKKDTGARFRLSCSSSLKANNTKEFKANNTLHISTNNTQDFNYVLYPNPVTNTLNIKSNRTIDVINVVNIQGAIVLTSTKSEIDFSNLPPSIYIVQIISGNQSSYKKIVKK